MLGVAKQKGGEGKEKVRTFGTNLGGGKPPSC